jgi:uncharacterized membrane protein YccC
MAALTWGEALFSLKTFAAAMLAVWIALRLDLPQPVWAMLTVYVVSQPLAGMVLSKSVFRVVGTVAGAAMALLLVDLFADAGELFLLALALWIGACTFTAVYLRDEPAAYGAVLSGYTAAIVGLPAALAPATAFDFAWARCLEITLGILCATLVSQILFPRTAGRALTATLDACLVACARWTGDVLRGQAEEAQGLADRRQLVADVVTLESLRAHAVFDTPAIRAAAGVVRLLQARLMSLLAMLTALQDRRVILRRGRPELDEALRPLLERGALTVERLAAGSAGAEEDAALGRDLAARLPGQAELRTDRAAILTRGILLRLADVLALWREIAAWRGRLALGEGGEPGPGAPDAPAFARYRDPALAAAGALVATAAVLTAALFWIATGWPHGTQAVIFAGVTASIMAGLDDPATAATRFLRMNLIGAAVAAIYVFALFPQIDGFASLMAVLMPFYLPFGMVLASPQLGTVVLPLVAGTTAVLGIGNGRAAPDFAAYVDTALGLAFGAGIAVLMFHLLRPLGVGWTVRRLTAGLFAGLAQQAMDSAAGEPREAFESRTFDRLNALFGRLDPSDPEQRSRMQGSLACLRVGLNLRLLRRTQPRLPPDLARAAGEALAALGACFAALATGERVPPSSPLPAVGAAVDRLLAAADPPPPPVVDAIGALAGIETSLVRHTAFFGLSERAGTAAAAADLASAAP